MEHPLLIYDFAVSNYICYNTKFKLNHVEQFFLFFFPESCDGLLLWDFIDVYVYCTLTTSSGDGEKQMSPMMIVVCTAIRPVLKSPAALVGKRNGCRWCSTSRVSGWARLGGLTGGDRCDQHWV